MTRTERNQYPAALLKDRKSRSGMNQPSEVQRKNGAGAHNWGSFKQEGEMELAADADAQLEGEDIFDMESDNVSPLRNNKAKRDDNGDQELDGLADTKDLKDVISTSPSDSMSSLDSADGQGKNHRGHPGAPQRRMSNVSDEERERARVYREGALGKGGIDLAHIARTSYGIAQSPPGAGILGTSPTKAKGGF